MFDEHGIWFVKSYMTLSMFSNMAERIRFEL